MAAPQKRRSCGLVQSAAFVVARAEKNDGYRWLKAEWCACGVYPDCYVLIPLALIVAAGGLACCCGVDMVLVHNTAW